MVVRAGAVTWLLAALAAWPATAPQQVFRGTTQTVSVYATVQSGDRLITDLPRDAFQILDNGRPQPITIFDNGVQPITLAIMLDVSASMLGNLSLVRNAAVQLFTRLLPEDRATVGSFGAQIRISNQLTNDVDALIRALWLELPPGGGTPLWPAVDRAMHTLARLDGRRVVLVLSDGRDGGVNGADAANVIPVTLEAVTERAVQEDFMIYAIGLRSRGLATRDGRTPPRADPEPGLRALATESGGGYFLLDEHSALGPTFARVADELHRQYLIGYKMPEADGRRHDVELRVNDPQLTVRARKSYVAPRGQQ